MGINWKVIARGLGGGAQGVLNVRQEQESQEHQKNLISMRARLDNYYTERRDRASRAFDKEMFDIQKNHAIRMQDRKQEIADRVRVYFTNEIGLDVEKGMRSKDGLEVAFAKRKLDVMGKITRMEELDENDMKTLSNFTPQAQVAFSTAIAEGDKWRQARDQQAELAESMISLRKQQEALMQSQIDFRSAGNMTQQQRMQAKAMIQGKINETLNSDIVRQIETRLSGLDPKDKQAYMNQFMTENPAEYMAYQGAMKSLNIYKEWDNTLNASDPNFLAEFIRQQAEGDKTEPQPRTQPTPKKTGTVEKMKDVYGSIISPSAIGTAKDIARRTPIGATAEQLFKTKTSGADMPRDEINLLAQKRNVDQKRVMSYAQFAKKRKGKTLKTGAMVAIKGKLYRLVSLPPNPEFEEIK